MRLVPLSFLFLATSSTASAGITLSLTRSHPTGAHPKGLIEGDLARATILCTTPPDGSTTVPVINPDFSIYTTSVGIGNPPRYYNLVFDTGSSNLVCGTNKTYVRTSTSIPTGEGVNVTYGSAKFAGFGFLDQVALAPGLVITNQSIADALNFTGFGTADGILGVGPKDLTQKSLSSDRNETIPTVIDNLVSQRLIEKKVFGVYFAPDGKEGDANGAVTYGGFDESLFEGELVYVPLTEGVKASRFWGINMTSVTYGNQIISNTSRAGIVDTGTTLNYLRKDVFSAYKNSIPGAVMDSETGLMEIPASSLPSMQPLNFLFADQVLTLDVAAQLVPKNVKVAWRLDPSKHYCVINTLEGFVDGLEFIIGRKFIERYYTIFDADDHRIGFAKTNYTFTTYDG